MVARSGFPGCVALAMLGVLTLPAGEARANGNYSHVWVAVDGVRHLPEGDLKTLLSDPQNLEALRNGAMFPDGGYAVGDDYGEISHWEPFHFEYLNWFLKTFPPPWTGEAARRVAFLMGMVAHGLCDQFYDGMYLQRHEHYDDPWPGPEPVGGVDGATDVCFAATQGPMVEPVPWAPYEDLAPLYPAVGHAVAPETLELGQNLVVFAVAHANAEAADPEKVQKYLQMYPWACGHQNDPAAPGSPVTVGRAIAAYWQVLWARLHGVDDLDAPLLDTWFLGGDPWDIEEDASSPGSWVSFAMPRGLDPPTVNGQSVTVADAAGATHPVTLQVYYGRGSHLVNVKPKQAWAPDMTYTVTISPPLAFWDGLVLGTVHAFTFSTAAPPVEPAPEAAEEVTEVPPDEASEPASDVPEPDFARPDAAPDVPFPDAPPDDGVPEDATDAVAPDVQAADSGPPGSGGSCSSARVFAVPFPAVAPILAVIVLALRRRCRRSSPRLP